MAQTQIMSGLAIDTVFPTGQLSLHDYRKLLSQQNDGIKSPLSPPPRLLKRKQAAVNLYQTQQYQYQYQYQQQPDFAAFHYQLQSPISSAPSSPPPLSFSQSVISLHGDLPTPISPASISRPFSQPLSSVSVSVTRRMDPFSTRLKKPKQLPPTHSRSSSQLTLPSPAGGGSGSGSGSVAPPLKVHHNGTEFEILNPKDSLFHFLNESPYRISSHSEDNNNMDREEDSPDVSPSRHSFIGHGIPDDMVRPISASESAVLSRFQQPAPPAAAVSTGMPQPQKSFVALPPLDESPPGPATTAHPQSAKTSTGKTLRQKVSRLFGSSPSEPSPTERRLFQHKPENDDRRDIVHSQDDGLHTPPSQEYWHEAEPTTPIRKTERPRLSYEEPSPTPSPREIDEETKALRRRTHGPHSSNRHQTLQDALRQLENENNGLSYEDIMQYIGPDNRLVSNHHNHQEANVADNVEQPEECEQEEETVERPWQPDTWHERPRVFHVPHNMNRPSDSNLSTNAPSTRASIRPYVEQAAAFMAGGDNASISSSESTAAEHVDADGEEHAAKDIGIGIGIGIDIDIGIETAKHASLASTETEGMYEMAPITPVRRTISRRARPLSSNPPDLDTPLISASPPPPLVSTSPPLSSSSRYASHRATSTPVAAAVSTGRISWSPEIPARHPDHRFVRFAEDEEDEDGGPGPVFRRVSPAPPPVPPKVVVSGAVVRKRQKQKQKETKHVPGCPCL